MSHHCMFPCFNFPQVFSVMLYPSTTVSASSRDRLLVIGNSIDVHERSRRRRAKSSIVLKLDVVSGALLLPQYQQVPRDTCSLLRHSWSQNWDKVVDLCALEPHRALHKTEHSGRTALHLVTFNRRCPLEVAQALLAANRHMILEQDTSRYTPLHVVAVFNTTTKSFSNKETPLEEQAVAMLKQQEEEQSRLVDLFCATAIMVEQELQDPSLIPPAYGTSPLFLAAKRNAPLTILRILLHTRHRTSWIAPSTGGEPYWDCQTLDEYSSPLEVLLRDSNRAIKYLDPDYIRHNPNQREQLRQIALRRLSRRRGEEVIDAPGTSRFCDPGADQRNLSLTNSHDNERETQQQQKHHEDLDDIATLELWEKCIELLVGWCPLLQVGDDSSHIPYGVLHAVVSCKVPIPSLVQVALIVFPEQAWQRDEQGMIPLHHVLRCNHKYATMALLKILLPCHASDDMTKQLQSTVLVPFPNNGPTPLVFALQHNLPVDPVVDWLLQADSDATLRRCDPSTGLYPFCTAALLTIQDNEKEKSSDEVNEYNVMPSESSYQDDHSIEKLNLSYRLLLAHPQVLAHCIETRR